MPTLAQYQWMHDRVGVAFLIADGYGSSRTGRPGTHGDYANVVDVRIDTRRMCAIADESPPPTTAPTSLRLQAGAALLNAVQG